MKNTIRTMTSLAKASLVYGSIARLTGLASQAIEVGTADFGLNANLQNDLPAIEQLEQNFSDLINGHLPMVSRPLPRFINSVDDSTNQTDGVEYICQFNDQLFVQILEQALFTARHLEASLENMSELALASEVHACRLDLVTARAAHYASDPIEG
jgi:hypothetical protein